MQLDCVERPLGRRLRQVAERGCIFLYRILIAIFELGDFPTDGMQPVVIRVQFLGAIEIIFGGIQLTSAHVSLGRRQLQVHISRRGVRSLSIEFCGFLSLASKLIGEGKFSLDAGSFISERFQGRDGSRVIPRFAIEASERTHDLGIVGRATLRQVQIVFSVVHLIQALVGEGEQQLRTRIGPGLLGRPQRFHRFVVLARLEEHLAQQHSVGRSPRIGGHNPSQNFHGVFSSSHAGVGLRQTGLAFERRRIDAKTAVVGLNRGLRFARQTRHVAEQEP